MGARLARLIGAVLALGWALGSAGAARAEGQPPIRIAVEGAFPPFNYTDANGELAGFEVELGKALCEAARRTCAFVQHDWDGIIRGLLGRDYDAIMSSLAVTARRKDRIAFSRRYYLIPWALLGLRSSPPLALKPGSLAGRRIGAVDRREQIAYLEEVQKGARIEVYGKAEDAILDLKVGRIDFVLADKLSLARVLETREGECCRLVADMPETEAYQGRGIALGLRKEDGALKETFDRAIAEVIATGAYDRIRKGYFSFDIK